MTKKSRNISNKIYSVVAIGLVIILWQLLVSLAIIPGYMLPSPMAVVSALWQDKAALLGHAQVTLIEAFIGLLIGMGISFVIAVLMDTFRPVYNLLYPIIVVSQTIPTVAIAPLLVLWFGYQMLPKIVLIVIVTFFPITIGLLDGFKSADPDAINLLRSMGADKFKIFRYIKLPGALTYFFAGLKISAAYSIVGAVIAEWLGGFNGLGVYMIRVKKSFRFDKMFAVIILVSLISLLLMGLVNVIQKRSTPWEEENDK